MSPAFFVARKVFIQGRGATSKSVNTLAIVQILLHMHLFSLPENPYCVSSCASDIDADQLRCSKA